MSIQDLLDRRLLIVRINVPDLELAALGTNEQVILIDLIQEGRALLVLNLVADTLATSLDVDDGEKDLLAVEAGNGQHSR